ncbi:MAG: thrombospondin type 3 repeat-containing protein [Deltaproteobacteria bacterium]|nr:thrombospondin type 3 repeat-containing protein [Deltaproteobacteria bacterium]
MENRAFCAAYPLVLEPSASCGTNCTQVVDHVCNGQVNWYEINVPAKTLITIIPDREYLFNLEVFAATDDAVWPSSEADVTQIVNKFDSVGTRHRNYVFDGANDSDVTIWIKTFITNDGGPYTLTITATDQTYDCVNMDLTTSGYEYFTSGDPLAHGEFIGGLQEWTDTPDHIYDGSSTDTIRSNTQACLKELNVPGDLSGGWKQMKVVRCVNGELVDAYDCLNDYPHWGATEEAVYGELVCTHEAHPGGELWCGPTSRDYFGFCILNSVTKAEPICLTDPVSGDSRYMFGCQSNYGFYFDENAALFNPYNTTDTAGHSGGYYVGLDCQRTHDGDEQIFYEDEAARSTCGTNHLTKETECLHDRQQHANSEAASALPFPSGGQVSQFPLTQNVISEFNPGEGNELPYVVIDGLSGILTDADVYAATPYLNNLHADGNVYLTYMDWGRYSARTGWGQGWLGHNADWATIGYRFAYFDKQLGTDIGDTTGDYALVPTECYDIDDDGVGNLMDNCPTIYNPAVDGRQPDGEEDEWGNSLKDGIGDACDSTPTAPDADPDEDGIFGSDALGVPIDNCPTVANADQADADHNGVGDACQPVEVICDESLLPACLDKDGNAQTASAMNWVLDVAHPQNQKVLTAISKMLYNAGVDGVTFDVATMSDCFAANTVSRFRDFLNNGGRLSRDINSSADIDDAARQRVYWTVSEAFGGEEATATHPDWTTFDIRDYFEDGSAWTDAWLNRAWAIFKIDMTKEFMATYRADMETFAGAGNWVTFYNQGESNFFNHEDEQPLTSEPLALIKDMAGSETFIYSGHPTLGYYDCIGVAGINYPASHTLEMLFDMHDVDGVRFWSWNGPWAMPDDRMLLFAAESLAHGGIFQHMTPAVEPYWPLGGYARPNYTMRLAQAPLAPWISKQWDKLNHANNPGGDQIALYHPQVVEGGCYSSNEFGARIADQLYRTLADLHYTIDVLGRGPFGLGMARIPTVEELNKYDFVVIAHTFLSDTEIDVFTQYVDGGGKLLLAGNVGWHDEWCEYQNRSSWLALSAGHGENSYGSSGGAFYQLNGVTAYTAPDGAPMEATEALQLLSKPNDGITACDTVEDGVAAGVGQLVIENLEGERAQLTSWLETALSDFGLPAANYGAGLPDAVHVVERYDESNHPYIHLLNYTLNAVPQYPHFWSENAGPGYGEYEAFYGCTPVTQIDSLSLPIPAAFLGTAGTAHVVSLDYAPVDISEAPFFPNTTNPGTPCATSPIGAEYPDIENDFAYPEQSTAFADTDTAVTLTNIRMKQWAIIWFDAQ